jgi:hypothetical protein
MPRVGLFSETRLPALELLGNTVGMKEPGLLDTPALFSLLELASS